MKRKKVIKYGNMPTKLPVLQTAVGYLLLVKFDAAGWVWGIFGTLCFLLWLGAVWGGGNE